MNISQGLPSFLFSFPFYPPPPLFLYFFFKPQPNVHFSHFDASNAFTFAPVLCFSLSPFFLFLASSSSFFLFIHLLDSYQSLNSRYSFFLFLLNLLFGLLRLLYFPPKLKRLLALLPSTIKSNSTSLFCRCVSNVDLLLVYLPANQSIYFFFFFFNLLFNHRKSN